MDVRLQIKMGEGIVRNIQFKIYLNRNDQWIGRYRGDDYNYLCILPTVVIQWRRKSHGSE